MSDYTIVMLYPDYLADQYGEETYLAHVKAATIEDAVEIAQEQAMEAQGEDEGFAPDFKVVFACLGHHQNLYTEN